MAKSPGVGGWIAIGCGIVLAGVIATVAALVLVVYGSLRSSDPYKEAFRRASNDPRVTALLGSPIETGIWANGSINVNAADGSGNANIDIPLKGPKGKATLHVAGTKTRGRWYYQELNVAPENGAAIDLVTSSEGSPSTAPPAE